MKQYKYKLDSGSKKFNCPICDKKTFVKYVDIETGGYLNSEFGRCDRETNCGYYSKPNGEFNNTFEIINAPRPEPSFHNIELLNQCAKNFDQNNFIRFLKTIFSSSEVNTVITKYNIGTSKLWNGAVIFWQIDNLNRVHAGKILQYNSKLGKRVKNSNGKSLIDWVHNVLKRQNKLSEFNLHQCLFGLHLVNTQTEKIALVESEKTAIIMSLFKPEFVWLATGSKHGFKLQNLLPLKKNKIVAFPDNGEFNDWSSKAAQLNKHGFNIFVSEILEKQGTYKPGIDLADMYIAGLN